MNKDISIVVPVYREVETIGIVLENLLDQVPHIHGKARLGSVRFPTKEMKK